MSEEQLQLFENYQMALSCVCAIEDEWLFREAVDLGRWLAQQA